MLERPRTDCRECECIARPVRNPPEVNDSRVHDRRTFYEVTEEVMERDMGVALDAISAMRPRDRMDAPEPKEDRELMSAQLAAKVGSHVLPAPQESSVSSSLRIASKHRR